MPPSRFLSLQRYPSCSWFSYQRTVSCRLLCAWFPHHALTPSAFGPPSRCCIRLAVIFQTTLTLGIFRDWDGSADVTIVCASPIASLFRVFPLVPGPPTRRRFVPSRRSSMCFSLLPKQQSSSHGRVPRGCVYLSPYPTRCILQRRVGRYPLERVTSKASCDSDARVMAYPLSCFFDPWRSSASSRGRVSSAPQRFPYRRFTVTLPCSRPSVFWACRSAPLSFRKTLVALCHSLCRLLRAGARSHRHAPCHPVDRIVSSAVARCRFSSRLLMLPSVDVPLNQWCRQKSGSAFSVSRSLAMFSHERCGGSVLVFYPKIEG